MKSKYTEELLLPLHNTGLIDQDPQAPSPEEDPCLKPSSTLDDEGYYSCEDDDEDSSLGFADECSKLTPEHIGKSGVWLAGK